MPINIHAMGLAGWRRAITAPGTHIARTPTTPIPARPLHRCARVMRHVGQGKVENSQPKAEHAPDDGVLGDPTGSAAAQPTDHLAFRPMAAHRSPGNATPEAFRERYGQVL